MENIEYLPKPREDVENSELLSTEALEDEIDFDEDIEKLPI